MSDDKQNREPDDHLNSLEDDHARTIKIPAREDDYSRTVKMPASNDDDHITTLKLSGDDANLIRPSERLTSDATTRNLLSGSTLPLDQNQKAEDRIRMHGQRHDPHESAHVPANEGSTRTDPLIGKLFAEKYEILGLAGRGGMSAVYKALHTALNKVVAIKLLYTHLAQNERNLRRFKQEAQVVSHLDHPGIVSLFDFGENSEGQPYLIMEFLKGEPLSARLSHQSELMSIDDALSCFSQLCDALGHAHKLGVIHRDLKPSNIFVEKNRNGLDQLKITDFGIAKLCGEEDRFEEQKLTATGDVFGSPLYMSPEQCLGTPVDQRSDIYSLGCVMYEVLTGRPPHVGATAYETMQKHVSEDTEFPGNLRPEIRKYGDLELILLKSIAHKREIRYQSCDELLGALQHVHKDSPFDPLSWLVRAISISKMRSKSKLVFAISCLAGGAAVIALLFFAASTIMPEQKLYNRSSVPAVRSKAPPGSWRKISEDAQELINHGKFKAAQPLLADAERVARKADNTEQMLITLKKQAFICQILLEHSAVQRLLAEIDTLHEKLDKEREGSEELRLLLEAFNANPDDPTDLQKEKFDSLSAKLIEWSRRLIGAKRYSEARNVLETLTAKLEKVPGASQRNRAAARLVKDELAVFEYRDPNRTDKRHDTWRNFQAAHEDLLALTETVEPDVAEKVAVREDAAKDSAAKDSAPNETAPKTDVPKTDAPKEDSKVDSSKKDGAGASSTNTDKTPPQVPKSPLSEDDFMWAITLRAYVNAVLHTTTDPTIETTFKEAFEATAKQSLDYYTKSGAKSPHASLAYMLVADGMDKEFKRTTANDLYQKALKVFIDQNYTRDAAHCYTEIANNLVETQKPMEAIAFLRSAIKETNASPQEDDFLLAQLYDALGNVYWHENNLESAIDAYLNEAEILQQITPPEDWLDLLNELAEVYGQKSATDERALAEAEPYCLQWLAILEVQQEWETEPGQKARWVDPIDAVKERLCYIYMNTKQHTRADKLFKERMDSLYKQPQTEVLTLSPWFPDLAQRYLIRRYQRIQFLQRLDRATAEANKQLTRMPLAKALDTYGRCYWFLGEKDKAVETLEQAANVVKVFYDEDQFWARRIVLNVGKIMSESGKKAEAAEMETFAEKFKSIE